MLKNLQIKPGVTVNTNSEGNSNLDEKETKPSLLKAKEITHTRFRLKDQEVNVEGTGCKVEHLPTGKICVSEEKVPYFRNRTLALRKMEGLLKADLVKEQESLPRCTKCGQLLPPSPEEKKPIEEKSEAIK